MARSSEQRDSQRQRLYDAEREAIHPLDGGALSFDECCEYLGTVRARTWYRHRWGLRGGSRLVQTNGQGGRAYMGGSEIRLGVWARRRAVILHELAHTLTEIGEPPHGAQFAGIFLFLVRQEMGPEAGQALREAYRRHRVRSNRSGIPAPTRRDATVSAMAARRREARRQPLSVLERRNLIALLDRAISAGEAGAVGTVARSRAQALRRSLMAADPQPIRVASSRRRHGVGVDRIR